MSFLLNSKITNAVKDYELTESVSSYPVSFSKGFEEKMDRFIKRKHRNRRILIVTQRTAMAVFTLALVGTLIYMMILPQNEDNLNPLSQSGQESSHVEPEQPHNVDAADVPSLPPNDSTGDERFLNLDFGEFGIQPGDFIVNKETLQPHPMNTGEYPQMNEWFVGENGLEYGFDRVSGALIGISKHSVLDDMIDLFGSGSKISGFHGYNEMLTIAKMALSKLADVDKWSLSPDLYTPLQVGDSGLVSTIFRFTREINGYNTTEGGAVSLTNTGDITYIEVFNAGLFNNVIIPIIAEAEIDKNFEIFAQQELGAIRGVDIINIEILERVIDYRDGVLLMRYEANFDFGDYFRREQFYIPIPS